MSRTFRRCRDRKGSHEPLPLQALYNSIFYLSFDKDYGRKGVTGDDKWKRRFEITSLIKKRSIRRMRQIANKLIRAADPDLLILPIKDRKRFCGDCLEVD